MSHFKRLAHSLISGYVLLGVNVLFTLASVPMALHYLSTKEFGLWANLTTIATYIALLDFGLSASAARILIDYKDHENREAYGAVIQTDVLVGLCQAVLILAAGTGVAFVIGPILHIPAELQQDFFWLVMGQCCITALMFVTRIIAHILNANSRFDVTNYSGVGGLLANFGMMWWSFSRGDGVFSMLWGQAASVLAVLALNWAGCLRLKLFPRAGQWGRPSWKMFRELFAFGRDVSLYAMGMQFINASQTMLLTRLFGLDAATVWNVYTRAYTLLQQVIGRIFDFSSSALAEMMVRGEREKLLGRFRDIAVTCVNLAVVAGALFAVGNSAFVQVWKAGKIFAIPWSPWNDLLLGIWLVISITVRLHTGLVGQSKVFGFMRYLYFIEGVAFICLTLFLHRFGGITMMLMLSIICSLCFTFPYGLWRTCQYFRLRRNELARWHAETLVLAAAVIPAAAGVWWFRNLPALQRLMAEVILGVWCGWAFLRFGLGGELRAQVRRRVPAWAGPILGRTTSHNHE